MLLLLILSANILLILLQLDMVPSFDSANTYYTYYPSEAFGPPIHTAQVSISPPHLVWYSPIPFTPGTIRVDPSGKYLYYPSVDDGTLWQCSVQSNATDCTILPLSEIAFPTTLHYDDVTSELYYWDQPYQTI